MCSEIVIGIVVAAVVVGILCAFAGLYNNQYLNKLAWSKCRSGGGRSIEYKV